MEPWIFSDMIQSLKERVHDLIHVQREVVNTRDAYGELAWHIGEKMLTAEVAIMGIGGDLPHEIAAVDQEIHYRTIDRRALTWLAEQHGISFFGSRPLAQHYVWLFRCGDLIPVPSERNRFYSHLIDCVQTEVLKVVNRMYFSTLEFERREMPPPHKVNIEGYTFEAVKQGALAGISFVELYAKPFVDYHAYTVRAQWDKMLRLITIAFARPEAKDSTLSEFVAFTNSVKFSHGYTEAMYSAFLRIAADRLSEGAWLKKYRDSLAHGTSQGTLLLLPQAKTEETMQAIWRRVIDEDMWQREAFVALINVILFEGLLRYQQRNG